MVRKHNIPPGGRAALTGFLFQITRSLSQAIGHVASIRAANLDEGDAMLILEPLTGGDARVETANTTLVEQHKTRSTGTAWTATEIIEKVLPDLWKAAKELQFRKNAEYRFVTSGRAPAASFTAFFDAVRRVSQPDDLPDDVSTAVSAFSDRLDQRALFFRIANVLKVEASEHGRLLGFLKQFAIESDVPLDDAKDHIDEFVRQLAEETSEAEGKRKELIGALFELAAEGRSISTVELLDASKLHIERLSAGAEAQARFAARLDKDFKRMGYRRKTDVRAAPPALPDGPIILLKGGSGDGKSWLAARWADETRRSGSSALYLRNMKSADELAKEINRVVWRAARFHRDADIPTIAATIGNGHTPAHDYWLTVVLDDPSADCLEGLAREDLSAQGVRLVIVSARIDEESTIKTFGTVSAVTAPPFIFEEAKSLLVAHGPLSEAGWRNLPADMRRLMRRPIFAFLYRETATEQFDPRTEYELMEAYWRALRARPGLHAGDIEHLEKLVLALVEDPKLYPWPYALVNELIPDTVCARLETVGVLQAADNGWVMEHDRILNWAAAHALLKTSTGGAASIDTVAQRFVALRDVNARSGTVIWRLGYLLMDLVAILLKAQRIEDALALARLLAENMHQHDFDTASFYSALLATAGAAALPLYEAAIKDRKERERPLPFELAAGLNIIAQSAPQAVRELCGRLLQSDDDDAVLVAFRVGESLSLTEHLPTLWRRYAEVEIDRDTWRRRVTHAEPGRNAFDLAVATRPEFLEALLKGDISDKEYSLALWRLAELRRDAGLSIWESIRNDAFERLAKETRLLAWLGRAFDDGASLRRVAGMLDTNQDDGAHSILLGALARGDADEAFALLDAHSLARFERSPGDWLAPLLDSDKDNGEVRLVARARDDDQGGPWLACSFRHAPYLANFETLSFVAADLLARLDAKSEELSRKPGLAMDELALLASANPDCVERALESTDKARLFELLAIFFTDCGVEPPYRHTRGDKQNAMLAAFAAGADAYACFIAALLDAAEPRNARDVLVAASLVHHERLGEAVAAMAEKWDETSGSLGDILIPLIAQQRYREVFELLMGDLPFSYAAQDIIAPEHLQDCADSFTDAERREVLDELNRSGGDRRNKMIALARYLNIREAESSLRAIAEDETSDASARVFACKALIAIGARRNGLGEIAGRVLATEKHGSNVFSAAAELCLDLDNEEAKDAVRRYFQTKTEGSFSSSESALLGWLGRGADLAMLKEMFAENKTRFAKEDLSRMIRNIKAQDGDASVAGELEDVALSSPRGIFRRDGPDYALRALAQVKPDAAFDIAANLYGARPDADSAARLWSFDPDKTLDVLFEAPDKAPPKGVSRLVGRKLNAASPNRQELLNKVLDQARKGDPLAKRFAIAVLEWLEGDDVETALRTAANDPDRKVARDVLAALETLRRRCAARQCCAALNADRSLVACLHLHRVIEDGDWKLAQSDDETSLRLPKSPLFGSLQLENYLRGLLRKEQQKERNKKD